MKRLFATGLHYNWKIVVMTIVSTLMLMVDHYHNFTPWKPYDRTILYLVVPLLFIIFIFRESPSAYGFRLGDWRAGLVLTMGSLVIALPVLWLVTHGDASMERYYRPLIGPSLPFYTFVDLFGWEFIFRGWLLFGYEREFGGNALWLQAVPFALGHIGKPEIETLSTIFGGFIFGWIAYRTKSFLYPFLIHWAIFTFVVLVAGGVLG